jgi:hypothetical protein
MWLLLALLACPREAPDPGASVEQIARHVRKEVPDKLGWANDVRTALVAAGVHPTVDSACQVFAIIEQESGYEPDPAVPNLAKVVQTELDAKATAKLGPLGPPLVSELLDVTPEGQTRSFREQLAAVKTEADVDRLFRAIFAHHAARTPRLARAAERLFPELLDGLNPVGTAGSMQVSVGWARARAKAEGRDPADVREALYTRAGGVYYGTARLFAHEAAYDKPIYRFADYNAGLYASRNAAFQTQLAALTGQALAPDGDLLIWGDDGKPTNRDGQTMTALLAWRLAQAPDYEEARLRRDAKLEKERSFEETDLWARLREDYQAKTQKAPSYARVPDVALDSPKLRKDLTTAWFAERVQARYGDCLKRNNAP